MDVREVQPAEHFISTYITLVILCPFKLSKRDALL